MKVLLIGNGAREHALAWLIARSDSLTKLYITPGNPGTDGIGDIAQNVLIDINDRDSLYKFVKDKNIDLVVIGPEQPLSEGLTDDLSQIGIDVFGPSKSAALLESSKGFAKKIMSESEVPTANAMVFTSNQIVAAQDYISNIEGKIVLKADGLAAGKGVLICEDKAEASIALNDMMNGKFGSAGDSVLVEEFMDGTEISVFAICDGRDYLLLPAATDHKRIGEGDTGLNTGGMGAFAPTPYADSEVLKNIGKNIVEPIIDNMLQKGTPFVGCLFCGLMITSEGPKVVEFNVRFGDPEIQAVSQLIEGDFLKLIHSASQGKLDSSQINIKTDIYACNVVLAAEGYPGSYSKGMQLSGLNEVDEDSVVFHAGTRIDDNAIVTSGGRVISVVGKGKSPSEAVENAYRNVNRIMFDKKYYRKDIAKNILSFFENNSRETIN